MCFKTVDDSVITGRNISLTFGDGRPRGRRENDDGGDGRKPSGHQHGAVGVLVMEKFRISDSEETRANVDGGGGRTLETVPSAHVSGDQLLPRPGTQGRPVPSSRAAAAAARTCRNSVVSSRAPPTRPRTPRAT